MTARERGWYDVGSMTTVSLQTTTQREDTRALVFQLAEEAVIKLKTLARLLSPEDQETLSILMDTEMMSDLNLSIQEAAAGKYEPIESILQ